MVRPPFLSAVIGITATLLDLILHRVFCEHAQQTCLRILGPIAMAPPFHLLAMNLNPGPAAANI
jgi:hypothetical protein